MSKVFSQERAGPFENERTMDPDRGRVRYEQIAVDYSAALARLAAAYEAHPQRRQDLLQDIHFRLWRSFETFKGECSLRTWVYRVAHNTAATHVLNEKRHRMHMLHGLEDIESLPSEIDEEQATDAQRTMEKLVVLIRKLKPLDRQLVLLYLEGLTAAEISGITGFTAVNVATKLHRFKDHLRKHFNVESRND